ncbi:MAG TPA: hypothetical protein VEQ59_02905 [Polyangiaceae bacterium]|nr:hypothetical protein [Polyangiaceae bacterium]
MDRAIGVKWSILAALGLLPLAGGACSGSDGEPPNGHGGSGSAAAGKGGTASSTAGGGAGGSAPSFGGEAGAAGQGGAAPRRPSCSSPVDNPSTGMVECKEGYQHRVQAVVCADASTQTQGGEGGQAGASSLPRASGEECETDRDCAQFYFGHCRSFGGEPSAHCESGCAEDSDCGTGSICVCSGEGGVCQKSNCATDGDCADGYLCASFEQGCGEPGFACQSPEDECTSNDDCELGVCGGNVIGTGFEGELGRRTCDDTVCGRPFLVEAEARVAPTCASDAWSGCGASPRVDHLTTAERQALAAHWTRMGQMEHASIAAFARFQLQLLALGAPPSLVEDCTRALGDETQHTLLCFGLASAYAGRAISPGALDISGSLLQVSLVEVVDLVLAEGCFGETSAALAALEAADLACDPLIAATYEQIARDEQRHAELAFRFVRWALERDYQAVAPRIIESLTADNAASTAVQDVVEPCLCALLSRRLAA